MADFSKFSDGTTTYNVKDAAAREAIAALEGGSFFLGVTTTAITDQSTTNPITVEGESVTAKNGNMVVYGNKEFVWAGESTTGHWVEFGDLSTLGALATADTAEASYTPQGTISEITPAGSIDMTSSTAQDTTVNSITDVGTLPAMSYDNATETLSFDPGTLPTKGADTTVLTGVTLAASFTGTAVTPTFTGTAATIVSGPST